MRHRAVRHVQVLDLVRVVDRIHQHPCREHDGGVGVDADRGRRDEPPAGSERRARRVLTDDDRRAVRVEQRDHTRQRLGEDALAVGDTDDGVGHLVHGAHLGEVFLLSALTFAERPSHRVERTLERADLVM